MQKVAQSGQSQVGEGKNGAIAESFAPLTEPAIEETLLSPEDLQPTPTEVKPIASEAPSSRVSSDISLADAVPNNSFEGYYDQRYFENSYQIRDNPKIPPKQ